MGEDTTIDNKAASEAFLKVAQRILKLGRFQEAENFRECGVSLEGQLAIADYFGLHGVIITSGGHARLVLDARENGKLLVYDPIEQEDGRYVYLFTPNYRKERARLGVTKALAGHYGLSGLVGEDKNIIAPDNMQHRDLLQILREKNYRLALPSTPQLSGLQDRTQAVCGPLAVYAMAIANHHTPTFDKQSISDKLKECADVEIR